MNMKKRFVHLSILLLALAGLTGCNTKYSCWLQVINSGSVKIVSTLNGADKRTVDAGSADTYEITWKGGATATTITVTLAVYPINNPNNVTTEDITIYNGNLTTRHFDYD
jgi:hypothetical protein